MPDVWGAAIPAGKVTRVYSSFERVIQKLLRGKKYFARKRGKGKNMRKKYRTYKKLYPSLGEINSKL